MRHTIGRLCIHLQQRLSEFSVVIPHCPEVRFVEFRVLLFEVSKPAIQLSENVVQPLDEIGPVVPHPNSAEVLLDRHKHLVETTGRVSTPHNFGRDTVRTVGRVGDDDCLWRSDIDDGGYSVWWRAVIIRTVERAEAP